MMTLQPSAVTRQPSAAALEVRYLADLQEMAGCDAEPVQPSEAPTLRPLLAVLAARHGEPLKSRLLDRSGGLADGFFVLVNGRHIGRLNGLDTALAAGDTVVFVPVIEFG